MNKVRQRFSWITVVAFELLTILFGCTRNGISTTPIEQTENNRYNETKTLSPELFAFIPWSENFPGLPIPSSTMGPNGTPKIMGYLSPDLFFASDTIAWLLGPKIDSHILRLEEGKAPEPFPFPSSIRNVLTAAPGPHGGLILFGTKEAAGRMLVRVSDKGETIWQTDHFESVFANSGEAELFTDIDGSVYLYTAIRERRAGDGGLVSKVNTENGSLAAVHQFTGFPPERVWASDGKVFWPGYVDQHIWVTLNTRTGEQHTVAVQPPLQAFMYSICGPLPDEGAVIQLNKAIAWMNADGEERLRVDLTKFDLTGGLVLSKTLITAQGDIFILSTDADGVYIYQIPSQ